MSSKQRDYFPSYQPAGKPLSRQDITKCFTTNPQPPTPQQFKKFRQSFKQQIATTNTHYGLVGAPRPPNTHIFGKKTDFSFPMNEYLTNPNTQGIKELIEEHKNHIYASVKNEPLASTVNRNYKWPQPTKEEGFKFGVPTQPANFLAKEVVNPNDATQDSQENHNQYVKTHNDYHVGEQKRRSYSWKINPNEHSFGLPYQRNPNEIKQILNEENNGENFTQTKIIQKNVENFNNYVSQPFAKSKNLAQRNHITTDPDHIFGLPLRKDEWGAGKCLKGEQTITQVLPDQDLGKPYHPYRRQSTIEYQSNRVSGVPSIRSDLPGRKRMKSLADAIDYGNEKNAVQVIYPEKFTNQGLSQDDFETLRSKKEIRDIFEKIGVSFKIGKFMGIFQEAERINQTEGKVSLKAFMQANENLKDVE